MNIFTLGEYFWVLLYSTITFRVLLILRKKIFLLECFKIGFLKIFFLQDHTPTMDVPLHNTIESKQRVESHFQFQN